MNEYSEFYKKQKDKLFQYLMRMTGNYEVSADILQESFTRYLERYQNKPPDARLLYTIARNTCMDFFRRHRNETPFDEEHTNPNCDQEKHLMVRQEYKRVLAAMQQLNKEQRDILALAVTGDLSYNEISEIIGITEANVKVKVHRARLKLKKILDQGAS